MERAARMSGALRVLGRNTARLALALYRLALDRLAASGFVTVLPPVLVREGRSSEPVRSPPTRQTSTRSRPTTSTSRARPGSRSRASTRVRSSRPTTCRCGTSPSLHASDVKRVRPSATRGDDPCPPVQQGRAVLVDAPRELLGRARAPPREHRGVGARARAAVPRRRSPGGRHVERIRGRTTSVWFPSQAGIAGEVDLDTTDFRARRLHVRFRGEHGPSPCTRSTGRPWSSRMALAILENFQGEVPDALRAYGAPDRVAS
jgi:hypothetical protein